jgi:hypothetical protein
MMNTRNHPNPSHSTTKIAWHTPALTLRGEVGDVLQFPGGGKISQVADDMGDVQRKPSGLEMQ